MHMLNRHTFLCYYRMYFRCNEAIVTYWRFYVKVKFVLIRFRKKKKIHDFNAILYLGSC